MELRNNMVKETEGEAFSWTYQTFSVGGAADKYRLTVGEEEGEGFDAMSYHNGQQLTVIMMHNNNCAYVQQGRWWYKNCYCANLNGPHTYACPSLPGIDPNHAIYWSDMMGQIFCHSAA